MFFNRSTNVSSKGETVDVLKQTTENTSEELSSAYQSLIIKLFFGMSLTSPPIILVKAHQIKEQSSWCCLAINGIKKFDFDKPLIKNHENFRSISNAAY